MLIIGSLTCCFMLSVTSFFNLKKKIYIYIYIVKYRSSVAVNRNDKAD